MGFKIAIGGKGGVGKTTVCAIWAQLFGADGFDVLAVDADPNINLCCAFGLPVDKSPKPLIEMKDLIAERTGTDKNAVGAYFRMNPKVSDLPEQYSIEINGVKLLVLGGITHGGGGCACPEGAFLKAMLTHTILHRKEIAIVDLAAGPEFLGRASIQGIDALIIVVEPGSRSIQTSINIAKMGKELGVKQIAVVLNKITDDNQVEMIKSQLSDIPVLAEIKFNSAVQQADLAGKNVFEANPELVNILKDAKCALEELITTDAKSSI